METKKLMIAILFMISSPFLVYANAASETVEVMLADNLDDTRGYCIDVAGGQGATASLDKGLQAHTCYHYTGTILEDQGFDRLSIDQDKFYLSYFDVCMSVSSLEAGESVGLAQCANQDTQKFELTDSGKIASKANPKLCLTVSSTDKKEGRGGSPVHVMRSLSLQSCETSADKYQTWSMHSL
ncbi:hypothetical protein EBI01_16435 [Marinomonas rhizomae]|uniref:Ricin-type beta-trefoil lectin protein n=1 Tax=Marinomonas rhizomae TaxID=491948 RepID=A0A366IWT6_9GAMM|nr:ricin-type beta-trefoil lectin domain protein [Marinomonas rhizomae]RBP79027.1 ricin-type beta-trefoil lectin protein [Marinomonas rhizomae]RNF71251.1 hypothetical protein EBI01_16435 [Marinomonas rhizomae]